MLKKSDVIESTVPLVSFATKKKSKLSPQKPFHKSTRPWTVLVGQQWGSMV